MGRKFYKITREGCKVREVYITESAVTYCNVGSTSFNSKETGGGGGGGKNMPLLLNAAWSRTIQNLTR